MVITRGHSSPSLFNLARNSPPVAERSASANTIDELDEPDGLHSFVSLRRSTDLCDRRKTMAPDSKDTPTEIEHAPLKATEDSQPPHSEGTDQQQETNQSTQHYQPVKFPVRVNIYFLVDNTAHLYTDSATESSLRRFTSTGRAALPGSHHLNTVQPGPMVRDLILSYPSKRLPSRESFDRIAAWMSLNRNIQLPSPVLPLLPPYPAHTSLAVLIDTYAATLALGLMPKPRALRHLILDRVSRTVLTASDMKFIWDSIPHQDGIVMRFVRAYYYHDRCGSVSHEVKSEIYAFTEIEPELDEIFASVEKEIEARRTGVADWGPNAPVGVGESRAVESGQHLWMHTSR